MSAFPTLTGGVTVCLPWTTKREYHNIHNDMPHGWRYSYNERGTPLHQITVEYSNLGDADKETIEDFWAEMEGSYGEFSFTHPDTGTVHSKCRFDQEELEIQHVGPNQHSVRVVIQEYA